jgi:hypothetical protein
MNVTQVTANATVDSLSDTDYADIYAELREQHTLRDFVLLAGSELSPAWWWQYEKGTKSLTRRARNDLRRAVGLAQLPPPVADAVSAGTSPDAAVYRAGDDDQAGRVLILATPGAVTVTWDGSAPQVEQARQNATSANVTGVISSQVRKRAKYYRPCLSPALGRALDAAGVNDVEGALWAVVNLQRAGLWSDKP